MKFKIFAFLMTAAVVSGAFSFFTGTKTSAKTGGELAALLPASDIVVTLDSQKMLAQALPQILSANQEKLAGINAHIDSIKTKTGFDLRQFDQVAVGLKTRQISPTNAEFDPFVLAHGSFNANALIAVAKVASKGKYREEKLGKRTIYIFDVKDAAGQNKPSANNSFFDRILEKAINGLSKEIAVTDYDEKTLAFGTTDRLREAFAKTKSRISPEVLGLVNKNPNAVMAFGGKMPKGLSALLPLDNDELGRNLDSIHQFSGSLDIGDGTTTFSAAAKTLKPDQAQSLHDTLQGLQMLGRAFLGGSDRADRQVYARMAENAQITRNNNEILLDLKIPQTDIDVLVGKK